jgi:hypothetical protein
MKRVAFCAAILAVFRLASAPAYARTTLADFPGGAEAIERLLERSRADRQNPSFGVCLPSSKIKTRALLKPA